MRITKEIIKAIHDASFDLGSQRKLSELSGIKQTNLSKYQSGLIKIIRDDSWEKLFPFIEKYLDAKDIATTILINHSENNTDYNHDLALFIGWLKKLSPRSLETLLSRYRSEFSKEDNPAYWNNDIDLLTVIASHPCLMPGVGERLIREIISHTKDKGSAELLKLSENEIAQLKKIEELQKVIIESLEIKNKQNERLYNSIIKLLSSDKSNEEKLSFLRGAFSPGDNDQSEKS